MLGREVKTILTHMVIAGINEMRWDGKNNFGTDVSTGIYFYRITAVSASGKVFTASRKMMLMR
jgi:flagellar hook assembly protein FlgD